MGGKARRACIGIVNSIPNGDSSGSDTLFKVDVAGEKIGGFGGAFEDPSPKQSPPIERRGTPYKLYGIGDMATIRPWPSGPSPETD